MIKPAQGPVTQGFSNTHFAVDYGGRAFYDTPILAPFSGKITAAGQMGSGTNNAGLAVDVSSGSYTARMCHMGRITVSVGQNVSEGQEIGRMGYTGYTIPAGINGTHCHVVLWVDGVRKDIRNYITSSAPAQGGNGQMIIQNADNWFGRCDKTMWQMRGRALNREEFTKYAVGAEFLRWVESVSDNPEADAAMNAQNIGTIAIRDNWQGQINTLSYQFSESEKALRGREVQSADLQKQLQESQAILAALKTSTEVAEKKAADAAARVEAIEVERIKDVDTGNSFLRWLGNLLNGTKGK